LTVCLPCSGNQADLREARELASVAPVLVGMLAPGSGCFPVSSLHLHLE
jgi:hypothetical protein